VDFPIRVRRCGTFAAILFVITLSGVTLLLSGCDKYRVIDTVETGDLSEALPFETLGFGQRMDVDGKTEIIVRNDAEWQAILSTMTTFEALERVDFEEAMVAIIAIPVESGGYTIEVEAVEQVDGILEVSYVISEPGIDCITPPALATPFQVVRMRRLDLEVRFSSRKELFSCEDF